MIRRSRPPNDLLARRPRRLAASLPPYLLDPPRHPPAGGLDRHDADTGDNLNYQIVQAVGECLAERITMKLPE
jgi:hypothetical protein